MLLLAFAAGIWGTVLRPPAYEVKGEVVARAAPGLLIVRHEAVSALGMAAMELMAVEGEPALFLLRPGDLTDPTRARAHSDRYLFDIIKHGGAPIGRPGMPAFGAQISDADVQAVVGYVRSLAGVRGAERAAPLTAASRSRRP